MLLFSIIIFAFACNRPTDVPDKTEPQNSDFFPLKVGNKWSFSYSYFYEYYQNRQRQTMSGERDWTITDVVQKSDTTVYTVLDIFNG